MTNAADHVLDAEVAANALVAELERLKSVAESLEQAHADSEQATQAAQDVVTTLNDVMPAVARVLAQLQALDLPALAERLAGELTASGTEMSQRLAGEIRAVTEPVNKAVARLESLPEGVAAIQDAQAGFEQTLAENSQAALSTMESLTQQIAKRDEAQSQELRRLAWRLAGVMVVGLVALAVFLWLTRLG